MTLRDLEGDPFCTGSCNYSDHRSRTEQTAPKIYIQARLEGQLFVSAVDTGGVYVLCDPEISEFVDLSKLERYRTDLVKTSFGKFNGVLYRAELAILAEEGTSVRIDATVFIPDLGEGEKWPFPQLVLGYQGCLERMKFAVDPSTDPGWFHFGPT